MNGMVTITGALAPAVELATRLGCKVLDARARGDVITMRVRADRLAVDRLALAQAAGAVAFRAHHR
jgi:hypothetical protein